MPHNTNFPPPNGNISPICVWVFQCAHTHCPTKPSIQFKSLYHQVQKQQGLLPDFSGHRKSLHFSITSSGKRQCSLRYVQYYQRPVKYQSGIQNLFKCDICWKMLPAYWQALCWIQLLSMHSNKFQLLQKITPRAIKWWGAQLRNTNHLVFSGTSRIEVFNDSMVWFFNYPFSITMKC